MGSAATAERNGTLEPGSRFGRYTVERLLGKGGMGVVYLMRGADGRRCAVKVMSPEAAANNPEFRSRFAREAEFAMKVRHRNLIAVHAAGEDSATGLCYLVMDYMPGGSLAQRLANGKRLSVEESVAIVTQVADALEAAHRRGIIHRDVKPDNIIFDADGTPKLADLGVAKFTGAERRTEVTVTGMVIGTPAYMAPEQMIDSRHIDARADIYALGVVFYEMLTGLSPHKDSSAVELLAKALKGDPIPDVRERRPDVPEALAYVISQMCAPRPEARPSTPHAVVKLLKRAMEGKLSVPKIAPRTLRPRRRMFPHAIAWTLGVASVAVVTYGLLGRGAWRTPQTLVRTNTVTNVVRQTTGLVDTSRLDPLRYAQMSDRELFEQMMTVDVKGNIKREIELSGGVDKYSRRTGTLSATQRKNMVNIFVCRDALEKMKLPQPAVTAILEKIVYHETLKDIPLGRLLDAISKMERRLRSGAGRHHSSSPGYMVAVFLECLPPKPEKKPPMSKRVEQSPYRSPTDDSFAGRQERQSGMSYNGIGVLEPVVQGVSLRDYDSIVQQLWYKVEESVQSTQHGFVARSIADKVYKGAMGLSADSDGADYAKQAKVKFLLRPYLFKSIDGVLFQLQRIDVSTGETSLLVSIEGNGLAEIEGRISTAVKDSIR